MKGIESDRCQNIVVNCHGKMYSVFLFFILFLFRIEQKILLLQS
jgi:hypothetical protein